MKRDLIGIDTNVLIPAFISSHPNHKKAKAIFEEGLQRKRELCITQQILAEFFSVVTRAGTPPLSCREAADIVLYLNNLRRIRKIYPNRSVIKNCLILCLKYRIRGAKFFDALYATTLLNKGVKKLLTQNVKDFYFFREEGLEILNPFESV
jgi:predicted nucleic acid-binding protein